MSAYKNYLENKSKDELVGIILKNPTTAKAVRNEVIVKEFIKLGELPRIDAYCHLSETHGIS